MFPSLKLDLSSCCSPQICSFAAAVASENIDFGFFIIWTMLLSLAYDIGGTAVLRNVRVPRVPKLDPSSSPRRCSFPPQIQYRTPLAVGFVIGVGVMMVQIMIFVAAFAVGNGGDSPTGRPTEGQEAVAAFAILKLFGYVRSARGLLLGGVCVASSLHCAPRPAYLVTVDVCDVCAAFPGDPPARAGAAGPRPDDAPCAELRLGACGRAGRRQWCGRRRVLRWNLRRHWREQRRRRAVGRVQGHGDGRRRRLGPELPVRQALAPPPQNDGNRRMQADCRPLNTRAGRYGPLGLRVGWSVLNALQFSSVEGRQRWHQLEAHRQQLPPHQQLTLRVPKMIGVFRLADLLALLQA